MLRFFRVPMIILNGLCKWFAVPLSATQAPVTGLTDILTPVNLLPNSDFSRSGGYAATQTFSTVISSFKNLFFSYGIHANSDATLSNVTAVRSNNSLRISGHFSRTGSHSDYYAFAIRNSEINLVSNRVYTFTGKNIDNLNTGKVSLVFVDSGFSTSSEVYNKYENGTLVSIKSFEGSYTPLILVYLNEFECDFDITLSDLCLYEGEFKNPPVTTSLDVKPGNQFMFRDSTNNGNLQYTQISSVSGLYITSVFSNYTSFGSRFRHINDMIFYIRQLYNNHYKIILFEHLVENGAVYRVHGTIDASGEDTLLSNYNTFSIYMTARCSGTNIQAGTAKQDINVIRSSTYCPIVFAFKKITSSTGSTLIGLEADIDTTALTIYNYNISIRLQYFVSGLTNINLPTASSCTPVA